MPIPTRAYAIGAAAVVALGLAATIGVTVMSPADRFDECRTSRVAGGAAIGGPFTLVDETGATVTEAEVITRPSLIYFGYTFCPDVCPLDSARNAAAVEILEERGYTVTPIFISIDPERDTPEVVAEFTDVMHPRMIGLTGSEEQVKAASQAYRTYFRKQEGDPEYYLVDHSTQTYLVFPEIGFVEFFGRETMPEQMAETVACFMDAAG